ncbi:MAG: SDR family oxidoreductase [Thermomicrobium sp.]|nr:SDR family oxidoreductase [Thermomicrobium sp.]
MSTELIQELFDVRGKVVLVTGGRRGIGFAIAKGFVRAGARVYICSRDAEACRAAAEELSVYGGCEALPADLSSDDGTRSLAVELGKRESELHVLVNNAGTIWAEPLSSYSLAGWDKVFNLNVRAPFLLIQALEPLLKRAATFEDPARVINIGSIDGFRVPPYETYAYSASKAALHHLSRHLAAQLGPSWVTVNVIAPGMFRSRMLAKTLEEKGEEAMLEPVPLKRFVGCLDVAGAALYLASRAGACVTGAVLVVDGGHATTL